MSSTYGHDITLIAIDKTKTPIHKITYQVMGVDHHTAIEIALKLAGDNYKYFYAITALKNDISEE